MSTPLDISRLTELMSGLSKRSERHERSIAVVLPLRDGMREVAEELLSEGPPFDPDELGLGRHEVFLTDSEAIFVFEVGGGLAQLDEMLAGPDFWSVAAVWERLMAGQPRIGTTVFEWRERRGP